MALPTPRRLEGFILFVLTAVKLCGQTDTNAVFAAWAQSEFCAAQERYAAQPDVETNAWQLGRATYDWAEFATNNQQRAGIAQAGIAACRHLVEFHPDSAAGHYYLGMSYGELAQAEAPSIAAYKLIREIEHEFKQATELEEGLDYGGPARCLGLLYRDAPGWPISIGSHRKAREYLERAAVLAPAFPENQMNLLESYIRWHEPDHAEQAWRKLAGVWPAAQTNFTGAAWGWTWADWTRRRAAARSDFERAFKRSPAP